MEQAYSTAVEGGAPVRMRYRISGRLRVAEYLAFVAERARWLSIEGFVGWDGAAVTLVAAGPEALVGALEMACLLGPSDALVEAVEGVPEAGEVAAGFRIVA